MKSSRLARTAGRASSNLGLYLLALVVSLLGLVGLDRRHKLVFFRDWAELPEVPNLDRLVPGLGDLCAKLEAAEANQYRIFRFDPDGAIRAAFVFLRMDQHLSAVPAETLALSQAVQTILLWSDRAFTDTAPLADLSALYRSAFAKAVG